MKAVVLILLLALTGCYYEPPRVETAMQAALVEKKLQALLIEATAALRAPAGGDLERAEAALRLAAELRESDPRVADGLGAVAWRRGRYADAERLFQRAIALDPNYDRAYSHLALLAERRGDRRRARELLEEAVRLNPLNFRARNNLAAVLLDEGNDRRARNELTKASAAGGAGDLVIERNLRTSEVTPRKW